VKKGIKWSVVWLDVILFALICYYGIGCTTYIPGYEYSDTRDVMRKQDNDMNTGQSAACFGGRIYYVSQENGEDGIFSMNEDGSDIRFELSAPKITRLVVLDNSIYYVGISTVSHGEKLFGLYEYDRASGEVEEVQYTQYPDSVDDAYVTANGVICVLEDYATQSSVSPKNYAYILNRNEAAISSSVTNDCMVQRDSDFVYSSSTFFPDNENLASNTSCAFLDVATGNSLMDNMEISDVTYFKPLYAQNDKIWFALDNELLEIDKETLKINFIYRLDDSVKDMKLTYMYKDGDNAYVLFEKYGSEKQLLYILQLEQVWSEEIDTFNKSKVLLHIGDGCIYWAENNILHCNAIGEKGISESIFEIKIPENIVKNNLLEIAGNWLFIYKQAKSAGTDTNQLLYKVNLETQEIISANEHQ
jgi:hypothetical protein